MYHILFINSSVDGPLDCFCFFIFVNSAATNICVQLFFVGLCLHFSWIYTLEWI